MLSILLLLLLSCFSPVQLWATPWTAAHHLLPPWDLPGKSTGVGCQCLLPLSLPAGENGKIWLFLPGFKRGTFQRDNNYLQSFPQMVVFLKWFSTIFKVWNILFLNHFKLNNNKKMRSIWNFFLKSEYKKPNYWENTSFFLLGKYS